MKKRIFTISVVVLVLVLALFAFTACNNFSSEVGAEMLTNGNFEEWDSEAKTFGGWTFYKANDSASYYMDPSNGEANHDDRWLRIKHGSASFSYLYQEVKVDRNAVYEISVDVKVLSDVSGSQEDFKGAYVTFRENTDYVFGNYIKKGDWITYTVYVKPQNTDYLTICLALGAEGGTAKGEVQYDNVSMQRVSGAPSGETVYNIKKAKTVRYSQNASGIAFVTCLTLFGAALLAAAYILIRRNYAQANAFINFDGTSGAAAPLATNKKKGGSKGSALAAKNWYANPWFIAAVIMVGTFLVRLIFLLTMYGFGSEMTVLANLAKNLGLSGGVANAYTKFAEQLASTSPGTIYILAIIGAMGQNLDNASISILIRMVGVLADMAVVAMIYFYGRKYVGDKLAVIFSSLYALLPVVFVMSGLSGTFASLTVALTMAAIILMVEKKFIPMFVVTVLAAVLDIRSLALSPIMVAYLGYMFYKDADTLKKVTPNRILLPVGLVLSFVLAYVITIPVGINQIQSGQPFFNFTAIANTVLNNNIFSENALNLYSMVGMNMHLTSTTVNVLNILFILVFELFVVSLYFKNRNKQEILLLASFTFAVIAVFSLKVDYTYLFLALALGLAYAMISGDKRIYGILSCYAIISFIGVGQLMNNSGYVAATCTGYFIDFDSTSPELIVFSVIAVLTTLYYAYVTYSITNNGKIVDIRPMYDKFAAALKKSASTAVGKVKSAFKKAE